MIEPASIESPHVASWQRFWDQFPSRLNSGLGRLIGRLEDTGIRSPDVSCGIPEEWIETIKSHPSAADEDAARFAGGSLTVPVKTNLNFNGLIGWNLGEMPWLTTRGSFIHDGVEHVVTAQFTRSPGVFVKRVKVEDSEHVRIDVRHEHGRTVRVLAMDGEVQVEVSHSRQISLGEAVAMLKGEAKAAERDEYALSTLRGDLGELGRIQFARRLSRAGLDPTLANESSPAQRLQAFGHLAEAYFRKKELPEDDPWDLGNLRVRLIGDFLDEALDDWFDDLFFRLRRKLLETERPATLTREALIETNGKGSNRRFSVRARQRSVLQSTCIRVEPDSGTFVEAAAFARRVTFNGPGGIVIGHEREPRSVNWSHVGRLCPFDTPQSEDVGITLSLAGGARVDAFGQIASRCMRVDGTAVKPRVTEEEVWVTPWQEADDKMGWIAFPDEREMLEQGLRVWAHRGQAGVKRVAASEVTHIHTCEEDLISAAASLVPYRPHNDALRVVMACSFLRQALPLEQAAAPRIATGAERRLPQQLPFAYGRPSDQSLALGLDLLVGYLPWKGWNFEDAIVVSTSASKKLTSLHSRVLGPYRLERSLDAQLVAVAGLDASAYDRKCLDAHGIVRKSTRIEPGDALIVEPTFQWGTGRSEGVKPVRAPKGYRGVVNDVTLVDGTDGGAWVRIVLDEPRLAEPGDKLANRHGHKGVISRVLSDVEMPYVLDGEAASTCACAETRGHRHLEVLINPLSVLSRMNLGQLIETIAARKGSFLEGKPERIPCFDPALPPEGRQLGGEVLVGFQYVMKLDHNAADKLHARSIDPEGYTAFAQQPLGGRRLNGGQRMGEMEVWALAAHGAPGLLVEMLTLKSDNPWARRQLAEDLVNNTRTASPELPAALRTWVALCRGLGLELSLQARKGKDQVEEIDLLAVNRPYAVESLKISLLDTNRFRELSFGEIEETSRSGRGLQPSMRYHPNGLESEQIFGPVEDNSCACGRYRFGRERGQAFNPREQPNPPPECPVCKSPLVPASERRHRMGHIALAKPVPNPYLLFSNPIVLGGKVAIGFSYDVVGCDVTMEGILDGVLKAHIRGSDPVENAIKLVAALIESVPEIKSVVRQTIEQGDTRDLAGLGSREVFAKLCIAYEMDPKQMDREQSERMVNDMLRKAALHPVDLAQRLLDAWPMPAATLQLLPVIPPSLRPAAYGRNDITFLYQCVIGADQLLRAAIEEPEKGTDYPSARTAQFRAIAQLFCNQRLPLSHRSSDWSGAQPRLRRSISALLSGKKGLLVGNLLGKRVDFSARAVIVPAPDLPIDTCRLPFDLAAELYEPLLAVALRRAGKREPDGMIARARDGDAEARKEIEPLFKALFEKYPIVLNRQPTLHRLSMLAFLPTLGEGSVIGLPPLVTAGFNADFDGDLMAVYLPLSAGARGDTKRLLPSSHLWHAADGRYALNLSQDLVLGGYLLDKSARHAQETAMEISVEESGIVNRIHSQSEKAFTAVTCAGVSFSGEDLRAIAARATTGDVKDIEAAISALPREDQIGRIVLSGARGKWAELRYLAGTAFTERPGSNLISGLLLGERFRRAGESRDNLVDTKLGTAEGGMLTKFFVSFAQHLRIEGEDCGSTEWVTVAAAVDEEGQPVTGEPARLRRRLLGRVHGSSAVGIEQGTVLGRAEIDRLLQWLLLQPGRNAVQVRSPLTCLAKSPACVCRRCYGAPPWAGRGREFLGVDALVAEETLVGIIAAQAAGEPGTQMALRSKHIAGGEERGGVAVEKIRTLFAKAFEGNRSDAVDHLEAIDRFFESEGVSVAGVHLEILVRGWMTMRRAQGWIAQLASPVGDFDRRLAGFALAKALDPLADLKARTVIGARMGA